jgi:long-chain fatty acid transport protein
MSVGGNRMSTRVRQGMRFGALAAAVSATLLPAQGFAAGFALLEQSASKLGTAFAGTGATTEDASVMYYNPAGL